MANDFDEKSKENQVFSIKNCYLRELPENIRIELLTFLFDDVLYKFNYFLGLFDKKRYYLCLYMQPRIYLEKSIILDLNQSVHELLLSTSGTIQMGILFSQKFFEIFTTDQSSIIGDYYLFNNKVSLLQYRALNTVNGYSVPSYIMLKFVKGQSKQLISYLKMIEDQMKFLKEKIETKLNEIGQTEGPEPTDSGNRKDNENCFKAKRLNVKTNKNKELKSLDESIKNFKTKKFQLQAALQEKFADYIRKKYYID